MTHRERLQTTLRFEEPDMVPVEIYKPNQNVIDVLGENHPHLRRLWDFVETQADTFMGIPCFNWGFLGLDAEETSEILEEVPGKYTRKKTTVRTPAGEFYEITKHNADHLDRGDFHTEKRYIETLDDFRRLARAHRNPRPFSLEKYNADVRLIGNRGMPIVSLFHPLGNLVRKSNFSNMYMWFLSEPDLVEEYLNRATEQVVDSILAAGARELDFPPVFKSAALEMLIDPWLGPGDFKRLVFPYDKQVNDAIHAIGGKHYAHCHGKCSNYLDMFVEMGIDMVEPLEPPPYANNDLADIKKRLGRKLVLAGNVPSQAFLTMTRQQVRDATKKAIDDGAAGGGFILHTTGGGSGIEGLTREQVEVSAARCVDFIEAAIDYR